MVSEASFGRLLGRAHGLVRRVGGTMARRPLLLGILGLVAACSGEDPGQAVDLCPRVAIINGLESLERTDETGAVRYRAALENIDGTCRVDGDDLRVDITIDVVVQPGRELTGSRIEVPYFVAVSAPNGDVLDRQDYVARINLAPGVRSGGVTETFTQRFVGRAAGASDYQVLFGFVLPTEEALRQRRTL